MSFNSGFSKHATLLKHQMRGSSSLTYKMKRIPFLSFLLNWSIVDLQCVRCTSKWLSYAYKYIETSLVAQWLRPSAFTAMDPDSIPGQGTKIPQAAWCSQMYIYIYDIRLEKTLNSKRYMSSIFTAALFTTYIYIYIGFPSGSVVKNLPAVQEMGVHSLGWEDPWPLEEGMATHSSILAWRIPWRSEEHTSELQSP